jgi:hypothetical protein
MTLSLCVLYGHSQPHSEQLDGLDLVAVACLRCHVVPAVKCAENPRHLVLTGKMFL